MIPLPPDAMLCVQVGRRASDLALAHVPSCRAAFMSHTPAANLRRAMKGAVYLGECQVAVRELPKPTPGPGEVLVAMRAAGLCGSDLHKYRNSREWAADRHGMIAGHEPAGVVAELDRVVDRVSVGDRVSVYHSLGCGHCRDCLAGEPVFCAHEGAFGRTRDGCHADYMAAPARCCLPLPDEFSFAVGAMLACTALTAYASVHKVSHLAGGTLAVFGLGPVGLTAVLMAQAKGWRMIGVEVVPYRLALAERLGAESVVDGAQADPVEAIRDLTDGYGASAVLECSGSAVARGQTVHAAAKRGMIVLVGAGSDEIALDQWPVLRHELTLRGNAVFPMPAYFDAIRFLRAHPVPLDDLVTHRFGVEQSPEAFAVFNTAQTGKVILEWDA